MPIPHGRRDVKDAVHFSVRMLTNKLPLQTPPFPIHYPSSLSITPRQPGLNTEEKVNRANLLAWEPSARGQYTVRSSGSGVPRAKAQYVWMS